MAEEIATVVQMEMDGVKIAMKASIKAAAYLIQLLKALGTHMKDARINRAGESRFADIHAISDGEPQVLMIPNEKEKEFKKFAKKNGLHYHSLADLNAMDGKKPFYIPRQEVSAWNAFLKSALQERVSESEKMMNEYDNKIANKREELLNASPVERQKLNREISNLSQAKEELQSVLNDERKDLEKEDISISFKDYLATGKGTTCEENPADVVDSLGEGGKSVPIFTAKEIFEPIRSSALVPQSKVSFVVPETGVYVTREFKQDDNGLYYSVYRFRDKDNPDGEPVEFSDQNVSKEEWFNGNAEKANFKDLLSRTGILENTKCEFYDDKESLTARLKRFNEYSYHAKNDKTNKQSFSNADVKREVEYAASQNKKGEASAENKAYEVIYAVPAGQIYEKDGKISVFIDDERKLSFTDISLKELKDGIFTFSVKANDKVILEERDTNRQIDTISARAGLELFKEGGKSSSQEQQPEKQSSTTISR